MYLVLSCDYRLAEIYAKAGVSPSPSLFSENSTHRSKSEPVININDPNDIAIKVSQLSRSSWPLICQEGSCKECVELITLSYDFRQLSN